MGGTLSSQKGRLIALIAAGCVIAGLVVWFSGYWPPVDKPTVQGAIGKREVYRESQLSDKDVGVAGTRPLTLDDVRRVVQSQEFKALAANPNFVGVLNNKSQYSVITNHVFVTLLQDKVTFNQVVSGNFEALANNPNLTAEQKNFVNSQQFAVALQDKNFVGVMSQPNFVNLIGNSTFVGILNHPSVQTAIGNGQFSQLATNNQLQNSIAVPQ